jgi:pyruvate ferredoxin oxidoreductase gamma subunit
MSMLQIRIHGRGGQGVVTAAEMLSIAAFREGKHAQAFPSFGSERTGAPVVSFCRIADGPIRSHEPISRPDAVIIQDPTLLHQVDVFAGLEPDGLVVINSARSASELGLAKLGDSFPAVRVCTVAATELARAHLGRPLPGAPLLGALAAVTGIVSSEALAAAIRERFPGTLGAANAAAAEAARNEVAEQLHA